MNNEINCYTKLCKFQLEIFRYVLSLRQMARIQHFNKL